MTVARKTNTRVMYPVDNITTDDFIKENFNIERYLPNNYLTFKIIKEKTGFGITRTRERIRELVNQGKLSERTENIDGHITKIYIPVLNWNRKTAIKNVTDAKRKRN